MGSTVLADIRQRFLYDAHQFSTNSRWQGNFLTFRDKARGNAQVLPKPAHRPRHAVQKASWLDFQWSYSLYFFSQIRDLVVQKPLQTAQILKGTGRLT
jgi:hypothetical protein